MTWILWCAFADRCSHIFKICLNVVPHSDFLGDFIDGEALAVCLERKSNTLHCDLNHLAGRFLAGLDARLVVGVDVDQRSVKANSPFKQCDQHPNRIWRHFLDSDRNGFSIFFGQSLAGSQVKPVKIIPGCYVLLDFKLCFCSSFKTSTKVTKKLFSPSLSC